MMAYTEYKVIHVMEGGLGTVFLGSSGLPLEAAEGWQVVFQVIEIRRFLLFWNRETVIVTLGR